MSEFNDTSDYFIKVTRQDQDFTDSDIEHIPDNLLGLLDVFVAAYGKTMIIHYENGSGTQHLTPEDVDGSITEFQAAHKGFEIQKISEDDFNLLVDESFRRDSFRVCPNGPVVS